MIFRDDLDDWTRAHVESLSTVIRAYRDQAREHQATLPIGPQRTACTALGDLLGHLLDDLGDESHA